MTDRLLHAIDPAAIGFEFLPVKRLSLTAAAGTTPFAVLFLGFSMFIIAATLLLVTLLFKLGIDQRAAELGIVLAVGLRRKLARRIFLVEGGCVAVLGAAVGAAAGVAYAWLMLVGLKTWWVGAISTPFLRLFVVPASLAEGFAIGVLTSLATIAWAAWQTRRASIRSLLAGSIEIRRAAGRRRSRRAPWIAVALMIVAIAAGFYATRMSGEEQAGTFLTSRALVLAALLIWTWDSLRADRGSLVLLGRGALAGLAWRNAARNPVRSTLTIGLTAAAAFLIAALSAFQLAPSAHGPRMNSGDGGFALVGQSDQPIYQNLNSADAREELGFGGQAEKTLADAEAEGTRIFSLRVRAGDDASCLNLYQPRQPRILGATPDFIEHGGFAWSATATKSPAEEKNPWLLLDGGQTGKADRVQSAAGQADESIPVVLDQNTALYSLHLYRGVGQTFEIDNPRGGKITLRVVGLLENSIFQGDLIIGEQEFQRLFPDTSGYRFFLVAMPKSSGERGRRGIAVADALENGLNDYGLNLQTTGRGWKCFLRCRIRIWQRSAVWERWDCCWGRSAWRPYSCGALSSGAGSWR